MGEVSELEVSKLHDGVRADGAPVLYILIKPTLDPEKADYKRIVRGIIDPLIRRLPQFSANIYDDRQSLVLHYMYFTAQLGRDLTKDERRLLSNHLIAIYDRTLKAGTPSGNLAFYPVGQTEDQKHRFFEEIEYDPKGDLGAA
jgi:hypothetical protein